METPRRIAYVINDVLLGGAQATVMALASKLDRSRFTPVVYYFNDYPDDRTNLKARFAEADVPLVYVGTGGKTSIGAVIPRLTEAFKKDRPDIIHTHLIDATIAGVLAAKRAKAGKVIIHEHQTHKLYSIKVRAAYWLLRFRAALTLCFSPVIERELFGSVQILSESPQRITRRSYSIYNGIDIEKAEATRASIDRSAKRRELGLPEDAFVITSVARLIDWKGQRTLLEAFGQMATEVPNAHICFVGEGPLKEELTARAAELGLAERVHLLGARNDVYEILAASDVGSLALTYEGSMVGESVGIAGFEVMGLGLPLIASDYPSAKLSVTDGENAILVPPKDVPALAAALTRLAGDPALRTHIGYNAAAYIRRTMNWSILIPIYERIYSLLSA